MSDFLNKLKDHPWIWLGGLFVGAVALTATVTGWFHDSHTAVLEASLTQCKERKAELAEFQDKFHDERVRCTKLEADANQAKQDLTRGQQDLTRAQKALAGLRAANWEEQYHAETVTRRGLEEDKRLAASRHEAQIGTLRDDRDARITRIAELQAELDRRPTAERARMSDSIASFDTLLADKQKAVARIAVLEGLLEVRTARVSELEDQVKLAARREAWLRERITSGKSSPAKSRKAWPTGKAKALAAAVSGIGSDNHAEDALVKAVSSMKGGVTGAELAYALAAARIESDNHCSDAIIRCSRYIVKSLTAKDISSMLSTIQSSNHREDASAALTARYK